MNRCTISSLVIVVATSAWSSAQAQEQEPGYLCQYLGRGCPQVELIEVKKVVTTTLCDIALVVKEQSKKNHRFNYASLLYDTEIKLATIGANQGEFTADLSTNLLGKVIPAISAKAQYTYDRQTTETHPYNYPQKQVSWMRQWCPRDKHGIITRKQKDTLWLNGLRERITNVDDPSFPQPSPLIRFDRSFTVSHSVKAGGGISFALIEFNAIGKVASTITQSVAIKADLLPAQPVVAGSPLAQPVVPSWYPNSRSWTSPVNQAQASARRARPTAGASVVENRWWTSPVNQVQASARRARPTAGASVVENRWWTSPVNQVQASARRMRPTARASVVESGWWTSPVNQVQASARRMRPTARASVVENRYVGPASAPYNQRSRKLALANR
jgi:hypothetical protein